MQAQCPAATLPLCAASSALLPPSLPVQPQVLAVAPSVVRTKWERMRGLAGRRPEWEQELWGSPPGVHHTNPDEEPGAKTVAGRPGLSPKQLGVLLTASHSRLDVAEWFSYMGLHGQVSLMQVRADQGQGGGLWCACR